jgi:2-oxoisovalerate dehydrogenase E1 component
MAVAGASGLSVGAAYRKLLTIRRFEERLLELHGREIIGSIHLSLGQEAIAVGALAALADGDRVVATYRGHHWAIACGVPLEALLAEITGRSTGTNGGRGGSAYLSAPEHGFLGENSVVGAGVPIAVGVALAAGYAGSRRVVVVSFGDGATNQGATHEGIVFAVARSLPVVFACENNGWSEMTPIGAMVPVELAARAAAYGLPAHAVDGNDPEAVANAVAEAAARAREGGGPTFLEFRAHRLSAHYQGDVEHYRPREDKELAATADPLLRLRARLLEKVGTEELEELERAVEEELRAAEQSALAAGPPDPGTARRHVYRDAPKGAATRLDLEAARMTYAAAINAALERELAERPEVLVFGEDVAIPGGVFGVTKNLRRRFGEARVFDTPIAEAAILGAAVGAAMEGMRPIVEIMFGDFLLVALDQLVNQAANVAYLSRGSVPCALVVRTQQAVTPGSCAQHTQCLEALVAHVPGLRVGLPALPQDAFAMTRAAVASSDPCILFESRALYGLEGPVTLDAPIEALGGARRLRDGDDLTIVTWGRMVHEALAAAERLEARDLGTTVVDLRWLNPLDRATLFEAVTRTTRVLVVHDANLTGGFGAEIAALVAEECFFDLDAPPARLALPDVRIPAAPALQTALVPTRDAIVAAAEEVVAR